jgi:hypothetical protein
MRRSSKKVTERIKEVKTMSNKMNQAKALALAITVAASGFVLTPPSFADDDCSQACEQVFKEAQNLPSPDVQSIKDYLNRVTDAGQQCLQCATNQVQGQPATDNNQSNGSSGSSTSDSSSSDSQGTD